MLLVARWFLAVLALFFLFQIFPYSQKVFAVRPKARGDTTWAQQTKEFCQETLGATHYGDWSKLTEVQKLALFGRLIEWEGRQIQKSPKQKPLINVKLGHWTEVRQALSNPRLVGQTPRATAQIVFPLLFEGSKSQYWSLDKWKISGFWLHNVKDRVNLPIHIGHATARGMPQLNDAVIFPEGWPLWVEKEPKVKSALGNGKEKELNTGRNYALLVSPAVLESPYHAASTNLERTQSLVIGFTAKISQAEKFSPIGRALSTYQKVFVDSENLREKLDSTLREVQLASANSNLKYHLIRLSAVNDYEIRESFGVGRQQIDSYALTLSGARSNQEYVSASLRMFVGLEVSN